MIERRKFIVSAAAAGLTSLVDADAVARVVKATSMPEPKNFGEMVAGLYLKDQIPGAVALSFDDGPREKYTPRVLDVLAAHGVPATFFVCGRRVKLRPDLTRRIVDEGHVLGNHTWSHPALSRLSRRKIIDQFDRTQAIIDEALGRSYFIRYYRPPFGNPWFSRSLAGKMARKRVAQVVDQRNGVIALWQLRCCDTVPGNNKNSILGHVRKSLRRRSGGVLCMHDANVHTLNALPEIISMIRDAGLKIVSLNQIVQRKYGLPDDQVVDLATTLRGQRR